MNQKQESLIRNLKNEWSELNKLISEYEKQIKGWSIAKDKNEREREEIKAIINKLESDE